MGSIRWLGVDQHINGRPVLGSSNRSSWMHFRSKLAVLMKLMPVT